MLGHKVSKRLVRRPYSLRLTLYSIITPFTPLKLQLFENIMENGAPVLLENIMKKYLKHKSISSKFFNCCLKIENDVMS